MVVKLLLAAVVGPICCRPVTVKMGRVEGKALCGAPGMVMPPFCSEDWFTSRRVQPKRA